MTLPPLDSPTVPAAHCTRCGGPVYPGDRFCGGCGYSLAVCAACGRAVAPTAPACGHCGATISGVPSQLDRSRAVDQTPAHAAESGLDATWAPVVAKLREALADEFEIDGELGHGGMAAVFRARELALNRRVAIKVMAPGLLMGEGMVERFRQEAITVANLQHANIVGVHSVRTVGDLHLFVMQYVPGRSLERALRERGQLPVDVVRTIIYHVGSALDYAHRRGVIHRDIKPGNILLDGDGDPVVTDFGIAKVAEAPGYTRAGTVVGTPAYMSPEQCLGHDVTPASDQYALGVVVYEMLTGLPPFGGSSLAIMRAHTDEPPASVRASRPDVPESIEAALMRMLAKRPEDRFPDLAATTVAFDAHPLPSAGPVRTEMSALAGAEASETRLADIVRAPHSPAPASRSPAPASRVAAKSSRPSIANIQLAGIAETIEVGECIVLEASAHTGTGNRIDGARLKWESSNESVASVDAAGVMTANAPGTASITASSAGVRSSIDVVIVPAEPATIDIVAPAEMRAGTRVVLEARAFDRHGKRLDAAVSWTSRNPAVATVSPDGAVTARRRGDAVLVAATGGLARAVTIAIGAPPVTEVVISGVPPVLAVGATTMLQGVVRSARSAARDDDREVEWRSSDPLVASISSDGVVTARAPGEVTITALCEGVAGSAPLTVVSVRAASVALTSPTSPLRLGETMTLRATVCGADGRPIARTVSWRSTDTRVATVDSQGRVTACAEGWAIVTAACDGVDAHAEVVVRQQVIPSSAHGRRESRRLAVRWWILLAVVGAVAAVGWWVLAR